MVLVTFEGGEEGEAGVRGEGGEEAGAEGTGLSEDRAGDGTTVEGEKLGGIDLGGGSLGQLVILLGGGEELAVRVEDAGRTSPGRGWSKRQEAREGRTTGREGCKSGM